MLQFKATLLAVTAALPLLSACSSGSNSTTDDVRTVAIAARDDLTFEPSTIEVAAGERVRFVVTNEGAMDHEFILGDETTQMAHESQMDSSSHMAMDAMASMAMGPGEMMDATVNFDEPGEILFGCHVAGHYASGMKGSVTVQ